MFIEYPKIKRLGDEETDGILFGTVYVEEKIDGANVSIWIDEDGVHCGSRTQEVTDKGFNGFVDYVKAHDGIQKLLALNSDSRLFGEWLVRHTIAYNETVYKQFYLFDIMLPDGSFLPREKVRQAGEVYGISMPEQFAVLENPMPDDIQKFVGQSCLGPKGEGVVLKNPGFINKFGEAKYAKVVTQEFKEDNAIVFGGNNKHSETYNEMYCVNKYMTMERIQKIMHKLQPLYDKRLSREQTGRVIQTAYHDMFTEEMWEIAKKFNSINFRHLEKLATRKAAKIFHDLLDGHVSVAYEDHSP